MSSTPKNRRTIEIFSDFTDASVSLDEFINILRAVKGVFDVRVKEGLRKDLALCQLHFPPMVMGEEAIIFRRSVLESWFKRLWEVFKTGAATILYESGVEAGKNAAKKLRKELGLDGEELLYLIAGLGQSLGWGVFKIKELDMKACRATLNVDNLFECQILREVTPEPASNFVRGYMVGVAQEIWKRKDVVAEEVKCLAKGDHYCEIKIKTEK